MGRVNLQKAIRPLQGPAGQPLKVLGQFTSHTQTKSSTSEMIYVVQGLKSNLLGFPAIQNLRLIHRVDLVSKTDAIKQQFAAVFK